MITKFYATGFLFHGRRNNLFFISKSLLLFLLCLPTAVLAADATTEQQWRARLTPLPLSFTTRNTITGIGQAQAELRGKTLSIRGDYKNLQGTATDVKLHLGPKAIPGPAFIELQLVKEGNGKQGSFKAEIALSEEQQNALMNESLYIQISSEAAKEGNLRGWLLPIMNN